MKIDWKRKLTSRKLWVSVASLIGNILIAAGVADNTVTQVPAIVMAGASAIAYIIGEGLTDAAGIEKSMKQEENHDDEQRTV